MNVYRGGEENFFWNLVMYRGGEGRGGEGRGGEERTILASLFVKHVLCVSMEWEFLRFTQEFVVRM